MELASRDRVVIGGCLGRESAAGLLEASHLLCRFRRRVRCATARRLLSCLACDSQTPKVMEAYCKTSEGKGGPVCNLMNMNLDGLRVASVA